MGYKHELDTKVKMKTSTQVGMIQGHYVINTLKEKHFNGRSEKGKLI